MRIKSFEPKPFEDIYEEFYMEHAQKCGSGSFGKVYLIQVKPTKYTYVYDSDLVWRMQLMIIKG